MTGDTVEEIKLSGPGGGCPGSAGKTRKGGDGRDERIKSALERIGYKIVIVSGKGGVGKSSLSVNLACALAASGNKVGLLDVDIHGPSVPRMLGLEGQMQASSGKALSPMRFDDNLSVVSMASLLADPDQAVLWRGPMKTTAIRQFIADVDWGDLDFLVIDSPPGTGDEHMTVLGTIPDALCVLVTTPQEVSLADVRKSLNFLQYAQANILGVVENMSGLMCPHCGKEIDLFKKGGGRELAKRHGLEFLGAVPLSPLAVAAGDAGQPVVLQPGDSPVKAALLALARGIVRAAQDSLEALASLRG